jgi:carbon-monoxide dehydrogenase large subunit
MGAEGLADVAGVDGGGHAAPGFEQAGGPAPFGCLVAVVEVALDTGGRRESMRMLTVDDCGSVVNPMLVTGQIQGGLASALASRCRKQGAMTRTASRLRPPRDYLTASAAGLPPSSSPTS